MRRGEAETMERMRRMTGLKGPKEEAGRGAPFRTISSIHSEERRPGLLRPSAARFSMASASCSTPIPCWRCCWYREDSTPRACSGIICGAAAAGF